jgi:enoyl-CoA hydratase
MTRPSKYEAFERLRVDGLEAGVLDVVLVGGSDAEVARVDALLHEEVADLWTLVERDPRVGCVLLRGTHGGFLAGATVEHARTMARNTEARLESFDTHIRMVRGMIECPKPIVSAARGRVVGEGLVLTILSDVAVVAPETELVDRHVEMGIVAGDHSALIWPLLCGLNRAKYHLLLGEPLSGRQAWDMGMVAECVEDAEVVERARTIAARLAAQPEAARAWTKRSLNHWLRAAWPAFESSLAMEMLTIGRPAFADKFSEAPND